MARLVRRVDEIENAPRPAWTVLNERDELGRGLVPD
jgi:hypothetical protein